MYNKRKPITKKEVEELEPDSFVEQKSFTRFADQAIVPEISPFYSPPRLKKEWSFEGTHDFVLPDGSIEQRQGSYVPKMRRL